jgi:hypothetical protein
MGLHPGADVDEGTALGRRHEQGVVSKRSRLLVGSCLSP